MSQIDQMNQIAVIGCGQWGKNLVRNFADLRALRAVCDTDPTKLAMIKERGRHGVTPVLGR